MIIETAEQVLFSNRVSYFAACKMRSVLNNHLPDTWCLSNNVDDNPSCCLLLAIIIFDPFEQIFNVGDDGPYWWELLSKSGSAIGSILS